MKVLYFGFNLPEHEYTSAVATDDGMPAQTQRFGWALLRALREVDIDVTTVSTAPVLDFPGNSKLVFRGSGFRDQDVSGVIVPFVNITGLKHLTRYVAFLRAGDRDAADSRPDAVLVHGVNSALLWSAIRIGGRFAAPVVVIITDPPVLRSSRDGRVAWQLKRMDGSLIRRALRRIDAAIVLTEQLATDFASDVPHLLMEGIVDVTWSTQPRETRAAGTDPLVVYAGGVSAEYGVLDLLEAIRLAGPKWKLRIYGRGPAEALVRSAARESDQLEFFGVVGKEELSSAYASADVLVNPRPDHAAFTRYSFPSKILEYMASGTPVVSTKMLGMPADYEPYIIWSDSGPQGLADAIARSLLLSPDESATFGSRAQAFAVQVKGPTAQGRRIRDFMESLIENKSAQGGQRRWTPRRHVPRTLKHE